MCRNAGLAVLLVTAAACASAAPERDIRSTSQETISISNPDNSVNADVHVRRDNYVAHQQVGAPRERVWSAIPAAFSALGLPTPVLDRTAWIATLENHVVRRRLGSQNLSALLECGRSMTGTNANTHRIHLDVTVQLLPADDTAFTNVYTQVTAIAENPAGTTGDLRCATRGVLENDIAHALQLEVLGS